MGTPREREITVCDVGPRDGLQNEPRILDSGVRAELCRRLLEAGLPVVEAASFVNPKLVPQMAGAEEVLAGIQRRRGAVLAGLVLNDRGLERAVAAGVDEIHYGLPVTDSFGQRNQNTTVEAAVETCRRLVARAHEAGRRITVTLMVAFGCPFEGPVPTARVLALAERVRATAPDAILVADTIGVGVPTQARELVRGLTGMGAVAGAHLHNTRNTGLANAFAALEAGATVLDASVGGTGGCPFAPRATGNIATEDLVYLLRGVGVETGIDLEALMGVSRWLEGHLGRQLPAMVTRAGDFPAPNVA
jgi:(R)-citramalyl-CoA lyase